MRFSSFNRAFASFVAIVVVVAAVLCSSVLKNCSYFHSENGVETVSAGTADSNSICDSYKAYVNDLARGIIRCAPASSTFAPKEETGSGLPSFRVQARSLTIGGNRGLKDPIRFTEYVKSIDMKGFNRCHTIYVAGVESLFLYRLSKEYFVICQERFLI